MRASLPTPCLQRWPRQPFGVGPLPQLRSAATRRVCGRLQAAKQDDPFAAIKNVAKRVQGSLPIIGLISRLASTEGGFDELAYPEFCRAVANTATRDLSMVLVDFEKKHGKTASSRWVLLMVWMARMGAGIVAPKDVMSAARRLRVTQDMEVEIDRFNAARNIVLKKYEMVRPPEARPADKANMVVDALCTLCIGLKDGQEVSEPDAQLLSAIVVGTLPELDAATVQASIQGRAQRAGAYAA